MWQHHKIEKITHTSTLKIQAYMQPYFVEHHCFLVLLHILKEE